MSNQFLKLRRSAVQGRVPTTSSLDFGEIALNTYDGLAFIKKSGSNGEEVIAIGGSGVATNISGSTYYIPVFSGSNALVTSSIFDSGSFTAIGAITTPHPDAPERLFVDASDTDSYNLISGHGTVNNYLQLNVKNFSSGDTGSSDIVATADNGDEFSYFIDMGINSSGYNLPDGIGQSNDAYLYSTGQDLLIGNASAGKRVIIFNGSGPALDNARIYINSQGTVGINASDPSLSNPEALLIEPLSTGSSNPSADFANLIIGRGAIHESYLQLNITNLGTGSYASADIVASNDTSTETSNYIDMGINGSNHIVDTTFAPGGANDTYLLSTGNKLLIGSSTSGDITLWTGADFDNIANAKLVLKTNNKHELTGSLSATEGFTGSLYGTASWAQNAISSSYPVAVNGTTLYSTGPSAGSEFSNDNSIFLGGQSAYSASNASYSNFIGYQAGYTASNATNSNFIGRRSGYRATNADYSIFIGNSAGADATNSNTSVFIGQSAGESALAVYSSVFIGQIAGSGARHASYSNFIGEASGQLARSASYSNFIGYNAGYRATYASQSILIGTWAGSNPEVNNGIGANNIIIGNNISFVDDRRDSINIGAIIFGTGSYAQGFTGAPFRGTSNGRIGINQPLPLFNLDVSGSGRYTNGLQVTSSLRAPNITGSLFGTASWALNTLTASISTNAISSSYALTASFGGNFTASNALINGILTAQTLVVQTVTSSVLYSSGSNIFGNQLTNTQQFTGSVTVTGSLSVNNSNVITSAQTSSMNVLSSSFAMTASYGNSPFDIGIAEFNSTSSLTVAGTTIVSSINTGSFTSAFYNYTIASGSNARAGQLMSVWSGSTVAYTEVTTTDLGNTAIAVFAVTISGPTVRLNFTAPGVWTVKSIANLL